MKKVKKVWLMKSEPSNYSIDDLKRDKKARWDGVRNYQARNFMMKDMQVGDDVLFYHSLAKPPGSVGTAVISALAAPDTTALDAKSKYYDPKATKDYPIWHCVEVRFKSRFKSVISIDQLRQEPQLKSMLVLKKGQRLSIMPVTKKEFEYILKLASQ